MSDPAVGRLQFPWEALTFTAPPSSLTFKPNLEQSDMAHIAGVARATRQLCPQLVSGPWEPFAHTGVLKLAIARPGAGLTPSITLRRGNTSAPVKTREFAQRPILKRIRRLHRQHVRLGR